MALSLAPPANGTMILAQLIVVVLLSTTSLTGRTASLIFLKPGASERLQTGNGQDG
jgi:hypothetical protein